MPKTEVPAVQRARSIAEEAHRGQSDKTGDAFIGHVERVVAGVDGRAETVVAWLHDVVEKGPGWSLQRLAQAGFDPAILAAVDAMTRRPGEDYPDFCRRAVANALARPVKRADLMDNLNQMRRIGGRTAKYEEGLAILAAAEGL